MPSRSDFRQLQIRLSELRKHFLPKIFSPTGIYTAREQDLAKAYRLLTHAELEYYFESIAKKVIVNCIKKWKDHKKPNDVIICLLAAYHSGWTEKTGDELYQDLSKNGTPVSSQSTAEAAVENASRIYINKLQTNNGIKEEDLKKILTPIGIRFSDLDPTWLADINNFAKSRGEVAHSSSISITTTIDPKTEYDRICQITEGVKKIDKILRRSL